MVRTLLKSVSYTKRGRANEAMAKSWYIKIDGDNCWQIVCIRSRYSPKGTHIMASLQKISEEIHWRICLHLSKTSKSHRGDESILETHLQECCVSVPIPIANGALLDCMRGLDSFEIWNSHASASEWNRINSRKRYVSKTRFRASLFSGHGR